MSPAHSRTPELIGLEDEYEVIAELGRGGSAVVYRARDRALGRDVAIKVVRGRSARVDDEQLARLAREARTVAQLDHPRIVDVYAVRQLPDGLALVMQWIPGRTLKQRIIEEGALPIADATAVLRDVAGALGAAHQKGIVHRDVKPENIFLDAHHGVAMLSDFGIAISAQDDSRLTMTGTAIGTPTYMAPELLDGGEPTPRSDVYALGLVAWEMLTGRQPWDGESLYGVIYRQKHDQLDALHLLRSDIPDRLQYVVERAMQKRPSARWAGGDGLLTQLDGSVLPADWPAWQAARIRRSAAVSAGRTTDMSGPLGDQPTRRFRRGESNDGELAAMTPAGLSPAGAEPAPDIATADDAPDWSREFASATAAREDAADEIVSRRVWPWALVTALLIATVIAGYMLLASTASLPRGPSLEAASERRAQELPILREPPVVVTAIDSVAAADDSPVPSDETGAEGTLDESPEGTPEGTLNDASPHADRTPHIAALTRRRARTSASALRPADALPVPSVVVAPVLPVRVTGAVTLAAGGRHTCVVARPRVVCWGANEDGQLGDGSMDTENAPVAVRGELPFVSLSAGGAHTCGIVRGGATYCWGSGEAGQLGDATTTSRTAPVRVASAIPFAIVRAGREHTCALADTGAVACWGGNRRGQLGDGTTVGRSSPVVLPVSVKFRALTVGAAHSCAVSVDGGAFCWGTNDGGQLGIGNTQSQSEPVRAVASSRFVDIAAGNAHTCAVSEEGTVWCWGRVNGVVHTIPTRIVGPTNVQSVTAGAVHSCARTIAGTVWCWGGNEYGQMGNGSTSGTAAPQMIGDRRFDVVVASGAHTCALAAREVWCWGYNADGQVGSTIEDSTARPGVAVSTAIITRPTRVRGVPGVLIGEAR